MHLAHTFTIMCLIVGRYEGPILILCDIGVVTNYSLLQKGRSVNAQLYIAAFSHILNNDLK